MWKISKVWWKCEISAEFKKTEQIKNTWKFSKIRNFQFSSWKYFHLWVCENFRNFQLLRKIWEIWGWSKIWIYAEFGIAVLDVCRIVWMGLEILTPPSESRTMFHAGAAGDDCQGKSFILNNIWTACAQTCGKQTSAQIHILDHHISLIFFEISGTFGYFQKPTNQKMMEKIGNFWFCFKSKANTQLNTNIESPTFWKVWECLRISTFSPFWSQNSEGKLQSLNFWKNKIFESLRELENQQKFTVIPKEEIFSDIFKKTHFPHRHQLWWCHHLWSNESLLLGLKAPGFIWASGTPFWPKKRTSKLNFSLKNATFRFEAKIPFEGDFWRFFPKKSHFPHKHQLWWCHHLWSNESLLLGLKAPGVHLGIGNTLFEKKDVETEFFAQKCHISIWGWFLTNMRHFLLKNRMLCPYSWFF